MLTKEDATRNMRQLLGEAINDVCAKYGVPQLQRGGVMATPDEMEYLTAEPSSLPQDGRVLVHNDVWPVAHRQGTHGSRFWLQQPEPSLKLCTCAWAPQIGQHFYLPRPVDAA